MVNAQNTFAVAGAGIAREGAVAIQDQPPCVCFRKEKKKCKNVKITIRYKSLIVIF